MWSHLWEILLEHMPLIIWTPYIGMHSSLKETKICLQIIFTSKNMHSSLSLLCTDMLWFSYTLCTMSYFLLFWCKINTKQRKIQDCTEGKIESQLKEQIHCIWLSEYNASYSFSSCPHSQTGLKKLQLMVWQTCSFNRRLQYKITSLAFTSSPKLTISRLTFSFFSFLASLTS